MILESVIEHTVELQKIRFTLRDIGLKRELILQTKSCNNYFDDKGECDFVAMKNGQVAELVQVYKKTNFS